MPQFIQPDEQMSDIPATENTPDLTPEELVPSPTPKEGDTTKSSEQGETPADSTPAPIFGGGSLKTQDDTQGTNDQPSKKDFGSFEPKETKKQNWYTTLHINTALMLTLFFGLGGAAFILLAQVNNWSANNSHQDSSIIALYKHVMEGLDNVSGYPGIQDQKNISSTASEGTISSIINSKIPYIYKKEFMGMVFDTLINDIIRKDTSLQDITQEIAKYGFIHPDTMNLLDKSKDQVPIIISLHTLETIKFGASFQIFSMLDSFLQQAAQKLGKNSSDIASLMQQYSDQGEKDIAAFLTMCYLNPYEQLPDCNVIGDFDNYLKYEGGTTADSNTFKKLIELIDDKLENSTIPSVEIEFDRFDPNSSLIGFTININTLIDDEMAFLSKKILNPHIYIASTLISLLKQSLFVIGDSISINKIDIRDQMIGVGNIQIPVKSSSLTFHLPFQKNPEREIYDFYNHDEEQESEEYIMDDNDNAGQEDSQEGGLTETHTNSPIDDEQAVLDS